MAGRAEGVLMGSQSIHLLGLQGDWALLCVCVCVRVRVRMCANMCIHLPVCTFMSALWNARACVCMCEYIVCVCVCVHVLQNDPKACISSP